MDIPGYDSWKLDTPPRYEDAVPPDPTEDAGADPDERLSNAVRAFLELAANQGMDHRREYSDLMTAADEWEWARVERAKNSIQ